MPKPKNARSFLLQALPTIVVSMFHFVDGASTSTEVLLVHAPYPGRLMFSGVPSSLLAAIGPFVERNGASSVGLLDPGVPSQAFDAELRRILAAGSVRCVCISTSTAAIEEAARVACIAKELCPGALVLLGGPHEDDVDMPSAQVLDAVDVSVSGDGEFALCRLLELFLAADQPPDEFCSEALRAGLDAVEAGRFRVALASGVGWAFDAGAVPDEWLRPHATLRAMPRFSVFDGSPTVPLMVSRGCSYGKCTFCAEGIRGGGALIGENFEWVEALAEVHQGAPLYFQDSIFPKSRAVTEQLLPLLHRQGVAWGCQVYLRALSREFLEQLADHGCDYIYTGLESASPEILSGIGKPNVNPQLVMERLGWMQELGMRVGMSLMFGSMSLSGKLLETEGTVRETAALAERIRASGLDVAGFYPNVQTVLPGTALARGLSQAGRSIDFFSMPRSAVFEGLEDGGVGHNFASMEVGSPGETRGVVEAILEAT